MEIQIKKAIKAGNSSAIVLPRSWLNKDVRAELIKKTPATILSDVLTIAIRYLDLGEVIGVYLVGSHARGEEDAQSDIDILIITKDIDKEIITEGMYNLLIISTKLLEQKLKHDLLPIGQMVKEAKPLLNSNYLNSISIKVTKHNVLWYLDTTKDKLILIKKILEKAKKTNKKYLHDKIAYTLILRIRTLEIIKKLKEKKEYSKNDFIRMIERISRGKNAYERYLAVKNNLEAREGLSLEEAEKLYNHLKNQFRDIKKII